MGLRWRAAVAVLVVVAGCGSNGVGESDSEPDTLPGGAEPSPTSSTGTGADFVEREVRFELAGTLSIPQGDGPHPAVVLVSGAGSQDRHGTIGNSQPQRVVADALARDGFVVLRFDDRGVGDSGGQPIETSDATVVDVADDAEAAVRFLAAQPEVDPTRVGIVGHSQGGVAATMVANRPGTVVFVVLLAAPAVDGATLVERQTADILRAEGAPSEVVDWTVAWRRELIEVALSDQTASEAEPVMREIAEAAFANAPPGAVGGDPTPEIDATVGLALSPWFRFDMAHDPGPGLQDLQMPVLALFGELDVQVSPETNEPAMRAALADNSAATVIVLDGLNHLFQPAITGARSEYDTLGQPFQAEAITLVSEWIVANT